MLIQRIELENFMTPGKCTLELPPVGVVVLTGANGAGKSRLIEAVPYAFWGQTLRGASPWLEGLAGSVRVTTPEGTVVRKVTAKGSKSLEWRGTSDDTKANTQARLSSLVGEMDFWRRTHVFSATEAVNFSQATNAQRLRLLELLLGLDRFDSAAKLCRQELDAKVAEVAKLGGQVALAESELAGLVRRLADLPELLPFEEEPAPPEPHLPGEADFSTLESLDGEQRRLMAEREALPTGEAERLALAHAQTERNAAARRVALAERGQCPECGSETKHRLGHANRDQAQAILAEQQARQVAEQAREAYEFELMRINGRLVELRQQLHLATTARAARQAAERFHAQWKIQYAEWLKRQAARRERHQRDVTERNARRWRLELERGEAEDYLADCRGSHAAARQQMDRLKLCESILGVKGLRGHVLGQALGGVEAVANYWLSRIAPGTSVALSTDEQGQVQLALRGMAGGEYDAASTGERRRLDAPLLLALTELAAAGDARQRGTLFLDELFDSLDESGQQLISEALGELGERQPMLVVTPVEALARLVPAVARYRVDAGQLERF